MELIHTPPEAGNDLLSLGDRELVDARREMLLAMLRRGRVRLQLMITELDEIGVSLKYNMVSPEFAVVWINDVDAIGCVGVLPWMDEQLDEVAA